ncbi:hypothetical protein Tco_1244568, partial [Tanacetum coccineum]
MLMTAYVNMWYDCSCMLRGAGKLVGIRCGKPFGVATLRAVVHAGDKTSGDARSWYMVSGDAKSWVCFDKGKWMVLEIKDVHPWGF